MTLKTRKELDKLVCEETNVKQFGRIIAMTERGELSVRYDLERDDYFVYLGAEKMVAPRIREEYLKLMLYDFDFYRGVD